MYTCYNNILSSHNVVVINTLQNNPIGIGDTKS